MIYTILFFVAALQAQPTFNIKPPIDIAYGIYVSETFKQPDIANYCAEAKVCRLIEIEGKGYVDVDGNLHIAPGVSQKEFFQTFVAAILGDHHTPHIPLEYGKPWLVKSKLKRRAQTRVGNPGGFSGPSDTSFDKRLLR